MEKEKSVVDNWKYYKKGTTYGDNHNDPICKCGVNWAYNINMPKELPAVCECPDCGFTIRWFTTSMTVWELIKRDKQDRSVSNMISCWIESGNYIYYNKTTFQITDISKHKHNCDLVTGYIYITEPKNMLQIREIIEDKEAQIIRIPIRIKTRILEIVGQLDGFLMSREKQQEYWNEIASLLGGG